MTRDDVDELADVFRAVQVARNTIAAARRTFATAQGRKLSDRELAELREMGEVLTELRARLIDEIDAMPATGPEIVRAAFADRLEAFGQKVAG